MQPDTTPQPEPSPSQRRGKIARLPRDIRDQFNARLDDGQEAAEILPWLNNLPEVQDIVARLFNGSSITPQNLSAWRQGGFAEWLLHRQFIDSALLMREHAAELDDLMKQQPHFLEHVLSDHLLAPLTIRFATFMASWDGSPNNEPKTLLKIGQFILRLQQANYKADELALQRYPRWRAAEEKRFQYCGEFIGLSARDESSFEQSTDKITETLETEEKVKPTVKRKTPVRKPRPQPQSKPIAVDKGSQSHPPSSPETAQPPAAEKLVPSKPAPPSRPSAACVRSSAHKSAHSGRQPSIEDKTQRVNSRVST